MKPTIYFATDHAGFELKNILLQFVKDELQYEVIDCGAHNLDKEDDYPDYIKLAARAVGEDSENRKAIILGYTGNGEAISANRERGVRAAVYYGKEANILALAREHNNANVLSLGAGFLTTEEAKEAVRTWLGTAFSQEERHLRRINKIDGE